MVICHIAIEAMAMEIVELPIENGGSFHSDVKSPEGKSYYIPMISPF